ncbi:MAG: hypothetical protein J5589_10020 [Firmicutes bacterium]|nr:hypothetical protein [Bacillota bacterium]
MKKKFSLMRTAILAAGIWIIRPQLKTYMWRIPYVLSKKAKFKKELKTAVPGQLVFAGDSITDFYPLDKFYPGRTVYNRGISGDATFHLLGRLDGIYALKPEKIVLLIGVNDFLNEKRPVGTVVCDYERILRAFRENLPDTKVVCESVYPTFSDDRSAIADRAEDIKELNRQIELLALQYGYVYADVYSALTDGVSDNADPALTKDGIHPNEEGYRVITEYLKEFV